MKIWHYTNFMKLLLYLKIAKMFTVQKEEQ